MSAKDVVRLNIKFYAPPLTCFGKEKKSFSTFSLSSLFHFRVFGGVRGCSDCCCDDVFLLSRKKKEKRNDLSFGKLMLKRDEHRKVESFFFDFLSRFFTAFFFSRDVD